MTTTPASSSSTTQAVAISAQLRDHASRVRLLVLDVDGVLTDGRLYYGPEGDELKAFHIHDGLGIRMAMASGLQVAIITGRSSRAVELRAENLGISRVYQGVADKLIAFERVLADLSLEAAAAAAIGDDLPDLPLLRRCGFAATVPDAPRIVRDCARYVTQRPGGAGAVREVCDLLMAAQGTLDARTREYLR